MLVFMIVAVVCLSHLHGCIAKLLLCDMNSLHQNVSVVVSSCLLIVLEFCT